MTEETAVEEAPAVEAPPSGDATAVAEKPVYGQISIEEFEVSEYSVTEQEQL